MMNRREFLATATACCTPHSSLASRTHPRVMTIDYVPPIDCHFHILPPEYRRMLGDARADRRMDTWSVEGALAELDSVQARMAVTSVTTPGLWFGDVEESRAMVRAANDFAKRIEGDHRGRFRTFAALALPDIEGSLAEIERMSKIGVDGFALFTSYNTRDGVKWLGYKEFEPVIAELNRRRAVVRTHPDAPCCAGFLLHHGIVDANVEYAADTSRALLNVIFSGWLQRYPNIKWLWGHGGGAMPFLIDRYIRLPETINRLSSFAPNGMLAELGKMYFDTAQLANPSPLETLSNIVSVDNILFGSDYPYRNLNDHMGAIAMVFDEEEQRKINRDNITRLLKL